MRTSEVIDRYVREGKIPEKTLEVEFDAEKHYLGVLCRKNHNFQGTGKTVRHTKHKNCMICMKINAFVWRQENLERARQVSREYEATDQGKRLRKEVMRKFREKEESVLYFITQGAKGRSKKYGLPCNVTFDNIKELYEQQGGNCYWTGMPFRMKGKERHPLKPSIDRIVPELGYTMDNIVLASNFANRARSDTPAEEFSEIMDLLKNTLHKPSPS